MVEDILYTQQGPIVSITLNRVNKQNAFNQSIIARLTRLLQEAENDTEVRIVFLKANGKCFSAGADLNWMKEMKAYSYQENVEDAAKLGKLLHTLYHLNKVTIAIVEGHAYGGGLGLIAACDMAVAKPDLTFSFSEVKLGLIPAVISPYILRSIGEKQTKKYFYSAETFNSQTAKTIGLINDISDCPSEHALSTAQNICANGPNAVMLTKNLLHQINPFQITKDVETQTIESIAQVRSSDEGQEGLAAFLEKRQPNWR